MTPTKEELLQLGEADPDLAKALQEHPLPIDNSSLEARKAMAATLVEALRVQLGEPGPGIKKTEVPYQSSDGTVMRAMLFQPDPLPKDGAPVAMLIHGGGFAVGAPETEEMNARQLVREFGFICYTISYRLAPAHKFPSAPEDAWAALQSVAANAKTWGGDLSLGFIVGGTSAGANLAAGLAHRARDKKLSPPLTGQWLACPWLCYDGGLPEPYAGLGCSYEQNAFAPCLSMGSVEMYMEALQPDLKDGRFNVFGSPEGHDGLPPLYIQISGMDPLRDEAIFYEEELRVKCGVKTRRTIYPGVPHVFWALFPALTAHARRFQEDMKAGFEWLLKESRTK
ncbi:alpha/beta-hydrolase [Cryphonectria parasitica EP155]|uniref:Alpha/beta-hydrolase n=1 Tax=Cryphonectria parasitica (strain ATCC 38755 / EP155) TaxID=660469 RepID=A0A9P4Y2S6_CRYP1|nr:alpha/beta-hydrolase [Cryphonectria parasitica EP155]KAF3765400.1 alpha/beta-hydrolase [Cryphonectria parasitica EP155]